MKKTLIILAHPDLTRSMANKKLKEEAEKNTDIIVHDIYKEYPNGKIDLEKELNLIKETGTLVLQFPIQWFNCPSLLKEWIDTVFMAAHFTESGEKILANKKIGLAVTTGAPKEVYEGKLEGILAPFVLSIDYLNAKNIPIFSVHGVMPGKISETEIEENAKKYVEYLKNNNKSTKYNIERRRKSGIYYFDNEGIAIFYQKEFNKKIVEKIDISLPYEDNLNISDIGKILNIEILKQIL